MDKTSIYYKQVQFLVQILPLIFTKDLFALKGGSAINIFYRDMPRLSVDIDLAYLGKEPREEALLKIRAELDSIAQTLKDRIFGSSIQKSYVNNEDSLRLLVKRNGVSIKIELSPVLRGIVFPVLQKTICGSGEKEFGFVEVPVLSMGDLYGGKICAALDRQHPRDFYDVWHLMQSEGITDEIRKGTLVYLLSHRKPLSDLLAPKLKDIKNVFKNEFRGMSVDNVELQELENVQKNLPSILIEKMSKEEKNFLVEFKSGVPDWSKLGLIGVQDLPAIKWKMMNLSKMNQDKRYQAIQKLERVLKMR